MKALPWLRPDEFWRMSPAELADALAGAAFREEREWERAAWVTAHLMNMSGKALKRVIQPNDLLGIVEVKDKAADFEQLWAKHQRQMAEKEQSEKG